MHRTLELPASGNIIYYKDNYLLQWSGKIYCRGRLFHNKKKIKIDLVLINAENHCTLS